MSNLPALRYERLETLTEQRLQLFHKELLEPAFPPEELMTFEELRDARRESETGGLIVFDENESAPVAGAVTEKYVDGSVVLLSYLVVKPECRSTGVGSRLLGQVVNLYDPDTLILAEIEDPRYFAISSVNDPARRVSFYDRVGAGLLPIPYMQPALREGAERVVNLLLVAIRSPGSEVDGYLLTKFLDEYYAACEGVVSRTDAQYQDLRRAAAGPPGGRVPVLSLSELHAARPSPR